MPTNLKRAVRHMLYFVLVTFIGSALVMAMVDEDLLLQTTKSDPVNVVYAVWFMVAGVAMLAIGAAVTVFCLHDGTSHWRESRP